MGATSYSISVEKQIDASLTRVWGALSKASEYDAWFSDDTSFEAKVGGRLTDVDGDNWLVTSLVPEQVITFDWQNKGCYEGSKLKFQVEGVDDTTRVVITQWDLASREDAASQAEGWSWALHTLDSYLTSGKRVRYGEWEAAGKP